MTRPLLVVGAGIGVPVGGGICGPAGSEHCRPGGKIGPLTSGTAGLVGGVGITGNGVTTGLSM